MHGHPSEAPETSHYRGGSVELNRGAARFMSGVYGWMAVGVAVSAVCATLLASSPQALMVLFGSPLRWLVLLAPLGFVWFFAGRVHRLDPPVAIGLFMVFAGLMGVSLAWVPLMAAANPQLVGTAFFVTTGMFAAMASIGWLIKKDLSGMGQFLFMALVGLIIAGLVNMFVQSSVASLAMSALGVLVFAGFTAYDTQKIKQMYLVQGAGNNLAILGALSLYLDFINLFIDILRLLGFASRDD